MQIDNARQDKQAARIDRQRSSCMTGADRLDIATRSPQ